MRPSRPDSAKSARTRITIDTDIGSKDLNVSKFSETYSNGVELKKNQKKKDFNNYVSEKNKDPKFKKFLNSDLPEIPQKPQQSQQLLKLTSKPFQKRSKVRQETKKEETAVPPPKQIQNSTTKKQNKSFVERNKNKLNSLKIGKSSTKIERQDEEKNKDKSNGNTDQTKKPKISFAGFTVNQPGKGTRKVEQKKEKKEEKKQKKQQEDVNAERRRQLIELSMFIQDVENRNSNYYPQGYEQFIQKNQNVTDIDKINIQDFINEPNEKDYDHLMKKINMNEKLLAEEDSGENASMRSSHYSSKSSSVNLDAIIDDSQQIDEGESQNDNDNQSIALTSMTASEIKDRNMFLTEILKGRITNDDVRQLKQNDATHVKLMKLEQSFKKQDLSQDEVEMAKINMSKKKTNKIVQRNKVEAGGGIYRQCDYLSPEEQQRIEDLINDVQIDSPFEPTDMQKLRERGIDEGIRIFKEMTNYQDELLEEQKIINQQFLPKDPILKKQAQLKILKEKISSVNSRLRSVDDVVVNKSKIQTLIEKLKDKTLVSEMGRSLLLEKEKQLKEQEEKLKEAQELIKKAEIEKEQINNLIDQLSEQYKIRADEVMRMKQMDAEELRQMELAQISKKRKQVQGIEKEIKDFEKQIVDFELIGEQIQRNIEQLSQIVNIEIPKIECENYHEDETIQDLDKIITLKWKRQEKGRKR